MQSPVDLCRCLKRKTPLGFMRTRPSRFLRTVNRAFCCCSLVFLPEQIICWAFTTRLPNSERSASSFEVMHTMSTGYHERVEELDRCFYDLHAKHCIERQARTEAACTAVSGVAYKYCTRSYSPKMTRAELLRGSKDGTAKQTSRLYPDGITQLPEAQLWTGARHGVSEKSNTSYAVEAAKRATMNSSVEQIARRRERGKIQRS